MTVRGPKLRVIVVGAGLSGLSAALLLADRGHDVAVLEARSAPGGRVRSVFAADGLTYLADLGPTWVWPMYQPVVRRWLEKLGLATFPQFDDGDAVLDFGPGQPVQTRFLPGQSGQERVRGGSQALIDRLVAGLPAGTIRLNAAVSAISMAGPEVRVRLRDDGTVLMADHVILAVPPRIALTRVAFEPGLDGALIEALSGLPTWMAPHAKAVAIYETAFWRGRGLSGRIASRAGPMVEAHDHSGPDGMPAAIFGFVGWPADLRRQAKGRLTHEIMAQLARCFGADAPAPVSLHVEDWAGDPDIATARDIGEAGGHPDIGPDILRRGHGGHRLWFAGAESATVSPGLIEGAFEAAERVVSCIDEGWRMTGAAPG